MSIEQLITEHLDIWTTADTEKKSGRGRGSANSGNVYGIKKLRELILELAVRGKLVPQDPNDEPASELLKRIEAEKAKLIAEGNIKKSKPLAEITEEEKSFELPVGWEWARLGNVIDYVNGFAFSSKDFTTQGIGVVKIGDIQQGKIEPEFMSRISEDAVNGLEARLQVVKGDLVIAMSGATTGKLGFNDTEEIFYLNQRVGKIVPFIISKKFLYFDLTTKIAENLKKSFGSAIPNLSTEQINTIVTALPPIEEQHRIVAKVDELMALCDQLENQHNNAAEAHEKLVAHLLGTLTQSQNAEDFNANWQRIAEHFDVLFTTEASIDGLKQTLLQLAVMGKLVPQDPNDEPASELLKRIQAEKTKLIAEGKIKKEKPLTMITEEEKPFDLPVGWSLIRFIDYATEISTGPFGSMIHQSDYIKGGVPLINPSHMIDDKIFPDESVSVSALIAKTLSSYLVYTGDIVMARRGEVGRIALVTENEDKWLCGTGSFVLRFYEEVNRSYLKLVFRCNYARTYLAGNAVGTTMVNLNHGILKKMPFGLPPIAEQQSIVEKVDELMAICDLLKTRITEANELQRKIADVVVGQTIN